MIGGVICVIGQILMDTTKLTTPRILVIFVVAGVALQAVHLYEPLVQLAHQGATTPLPGFGYALAKRERWKEQSDGFLGAITGAVKDTAAGGRGHRLRIYHFADLQPEVAEVKRGPKSGRAEPSAQKDGPGAQKKQARSAEGQAGRACCEKSMEKICVLFRFFDRYFIYSSKKKRRQKHLQKPLKYGKLIRFENHI